MAGEGDPADSRKLDSGDGQWPGGLRSWVGLALCFPERLLPRLFKCQVCCGDQAVGGTLLQILGPASCKWAKARVQGALGLGPGSGCVLQGFLSPRIPLELLVVPVLETGNWLVGPGRLQVSEWTEKVPGNDCWVPVPIPGCQLGHLERERAPGQESRWWLVPGESGE